MAEIRDACLGRPVWLSFRTDSVGAIRRRRLAGTPGGLDERVCGLLHRVHSIRASLLIGALACVLPVGLSVALGVQGPTGGDGDTSPMGLALLTVAAVLGSVGGLLFAAIVFGIQFHGERLGHASFLIRYLVRREGIVPIAAFVLGVIAANVFVGLLAIRWLPASSAVMAGCDFALVSLALLSVLWLLYRLVVGVSGDFFEHSLKPGLGWEYQREFDEEVHRAKLTEAYEAELARRHLEYSRLAKREPCSRTAATTFKLKQRREVKDVYLRKLDAIGNLVREAWPHHRASFAVGPGDRVDDGPVLVLLPSRDAARGQADSPVVSDRSIRRMQALVEQVFWLRRPRDREVADVLERFADTIINHAKYDRPDQLKRALEVQKYLIDEWLRRTELDRLPDSFWCQSRLNPMRNVKCADLAASVVASGDHEKVEIVFFFAARLMKLAIEQGRTDLFREASGVFDAAYWHGIANEGVQTWIGQKIDSWLHIMLGQLKAWHPSAYQGDHFDEARIEKERPLVKMAIAWVLGLWKTAVEAGRKQDASDFQDRLAGPESRRHEVFGGLSSDAIPDGLNEARILRAYAQIAIAGWCVFLARKPERRSDAEKKDAVTDSFRRAASLFPSQAAVVEAWEAGQCRSAPGGGIEQDLGLDQWDEPQRRWRLGKPSVLPSELWIHDGFVALGLACPHDPGGRPVRWAKSPAVNYDMAMVTGFADQLLSDDYVRGELLQLKGDAVDKARESFLGLIGTQAAADKKEALRRVIDADVDLQGIEEVRRRVEQSLDEHRWLVRLIRELGGLQRPASAWLRPRIEYRAAVSKTEFIRGETRSSNLYDVLATQVGTWELGRIAMEVEHRGTVAAAVSRADEVAPAVRRAIRTLTERGFHPSLILVPRLNEVVTALLGSEWHTRDAFRESHLLGAFDGLSVVGWEHSDPCSIGIVDVAAFYGRVESAAPASLLSIDVDADRPPGGQAEWPRVHPETLNSHRRDAGATPLSGRTPKAAEEVTDPRAIANPADVNVLVTVRLVPGVGLADPGAAVRVDVDPREFGYAMRRSDGVYHRPECPLLDGAEDVEYALGSMAEDDESPRAPCEQCRPDRWGL